MWTIFQKDFERQKFVYGIYLLAVVVLAIVAPLGNQTAFVFSLIPATLFLAVSLAQVLSETAEDKNNAYHFLHILPIRTRNLIIFKFFTILLATLILTGISGLIYLIAFQGDTATGWATLLILGSAASLILASLAFAGMYILGMLVFGRVMIGVLVLAQIGIFAIGLNRYRNGNLIQTLFTSFSEVMTASPWFIVGTAIFIWAIIGGLTTLIGHRTQV